MIINIGKTQAVYSGFVLFDLGGIIGFSSSHGTIQRWILTSHIAAKLRSSMDETLSISRNTRCKLNRPSRIQFDEEAVKSSYRILSSWTSIFGESDGIVSLSSGRFAPQDVQTDLERAEKIGRNCFDSFVEERLVSKQVFSFVIIDYLWLRRDEKILCSTCNKAERRRESFGYCINSTIQYFVFFYF